MISRHAGHLAASPDDRHDSWPSRESTAFTGGDDRDGDGSDKKQKKKKKRRQKDEGPYEHPEMQAQGENSPPTEEFYHRIGPRRDRGDGGWEEQLGKSGGRGKKGKSRKKLPEEWAVMAEPFVPLSATTSKITEEVIKELGSSAHANVEASFTEMDSSHNTWKQEVFPEEGLVPAPLSEDLFFPTIPSISPLVLNSELKATAPPFTMPSPANVTAIDSSPVAPAALEEFDPLMDTKNAMLGKSTLSFSTPLSPEIDEGVGDVVDSNIPYDTTALQGSFVQGIPGEDTSPFTPASQSGSESSMQAEVLASAPPLSPSDASWLLNNSHMGGESELLDFSEISSSGHPLMLGLSFDTPSPAPLRSPKTTAQESHLRERKDDKPSQKQPVKSLSSSPAKIPDSQASPLISPSSPPTVNASGVQGSGLNPAAKPFFPSFADPLEEPEALPVFAPSIEGWLLSTPEK